MEKKMKRVLVFWPVSNEENIGRHDFDLLSDEDIWKKLPEGSRTYDLDCKEWHGRIPDLGDFVEDYNDEELDGGWWTAVLTIPEYLILE